MNLSQLEVFVAIVDTGSLTEAAEVVGLTQSAVSYSLSRLEAELGVTLLERSRQGVTVTSIGKEVLQNARTILAQAEGIRQKTNRERGLSVGKVRFGTVPNIAARLLTGILRDFQHKYPEMEIVLFEGNPHELLEWLETDVVDVATVPQVSEHYRKTLPFVSATLNVLLAEGHPLIEKETITLEMLADFPLVGPRSQYRMFKTMLAQHGLSVPSLRYEVSSQSTILTMVRENMGISLMPEMIYDAKSEGIVILPVHPRIQFRIHLATHSDSPAVLAFMKNAHHWSKDHGFLSVD